MAVTNKAIRTERSTASRRVVTNRSGHFTGYFFSMKNGRVIQYESILERDYIYLIETDRAVKSYTEQPEKLVWLDGIGKEHKTTFDFCVERATGNYLIEVKPLSKVLKHRLDDLYGYAKAAAKAQGYAGFELWTDRELKSLPRLTNAEILVSTNTTYHDHDIAFAVDAAVFEIAKTRRRITVRELRAKMPSALRAQSYREVMRLVAMRRLVPAVETALLDDDALLLIPGGIDG